jgi:hypothetical protein
LARQLPFFTNVPAKSLIPALESAPSTNNFAQAAERLIHGGVRSVRVAAFELLQRSAAAAGFGLASYRPSTRRTDFARVRALRKQRSSLMTPLESVQLLNAVRATTKIGGSMAEVGVFQGVSARLIREADSTRPLHLFDTFAGLPATDADDTSHGYGPFSAGDFACSLASVRAYLSDLTSVTFHQGIFPETGSDVQDERFSFVHLDVDLYRSSLESLEWFHQRMLPGGIILTHDYGTCAGPRHAWTEFFRDKSEPVIELPGDQAVIVKL